jgi:hypothetical protein
MLSRGIFRLTAVLLVAVLAILLIGVANARAPQANGAQDLVRTQSRHSHTLDEEFTQLWYMKTTDYGATWSPFTQAGDLSSFSPSRGLLPDFQTITTATNQVCFVVYLDSAATKGVYSFTSPTFQPVLVRANGPTDTLVTVGGTNPKGWTTIGADPNGNLYCVIWGYTGAQQVTTFWGVKSTDNGASWGTPFIVYQETNGDHAGAYPHLSQMNSTTNVFIMYQAVSGTNYNQYVGRFPVAGGAATFVQIGSTESQYSYYIGSCLPLAYDNVNNYLYAVYRTDATSGSGSTVYYSSDQGQNFTPSSLATGGTRYPAISLRIADQTPFVVSNMGPPAAGAVHQAWLTWDQFGYGGGSWVIPPISFASAPGPYDGTGPLLYVNQVYWWDANHGASSLNLWGARTPEGEYTNYTTNGGASPADWSAAQALWVAANDSIDPVTANMNQITGGTNGIGYITTSFARGTADVVPPVVTDQTLLTSYMSTGPYVVSAFVSDDRGIDASTINWIWNPADTGATNIFFPQDSVHLTDSATASGTYYYTIRDTASNGHHWVDGDTIWFYCDATDVGGNYTSADLQAIVVGSAYLGVGDRVSVPVEKFALNGNYPNPFNPSTQISFDLPAMYRVNLKVFNVLGEQVATLADGQFYAEGRHTLTFDGSRLSSGIYFYTLSAGPYVASQKMVLLK